MMTLIFTFDKNWVLREGIEFLKGDDLIDVMCWVQGHNHDDYNVHIKRCADGYRMYVDVDI